MTLDRNTNHSLSENSGLREKARAVIEHINSNEYCGLDRLGKLLVYLFFTYLTIEDRKKEEGGNRIDIEKNLSYEDLTTLAYRALNIEQKSGMEGEEVFSFILSLRDRLSYNQEEALKRGYNVPSSSFFSEVDFKIEENEFFELISFIWRRYISGKFTSKETKLSESILSISDGDYIYVDSFFLPGLFMTIGKDKECDILFSIFDDYERTLSKMLFYMTVPKYKWNKYRIVKEEKEEEGLRNKNSQGKEYPNRIISMGADFPNVRTRGVFADSLYLIMPLIEKGAKALFFTTSRLLSFKMDKYKEYREKIFNFDASLSVLSIYRDDTNIVVLDGSDKNRDEVLMLYLDEVDIVFDDESCSEIAAAISFDVENSGELKKRVLKIERDKIKDNDYMFYPPYYIEREVGEVGEISEIDKKLEDKYRELNMLCRKIARKAN